MTATAVLRLLGALIIAALAHCLPAASEELGRFTGQVTTVWLGDGRNMRLVEPFEFVAPDGTHWPVPSGVIVDGASIPQIFWSLIGGPFTGPYRNASVIHDYYCDVRTRSYQDVHRVFYTAMRASGVSENKAWLMYKAVEKFGPTWELPKLDKRCEGPNFDFEICALAAKKPPKRTPKLSADALKQFADEVGAKADPEDLRKLKAAIDQVGN
jgi:Protein of unknown function (DUF1353)